MEEFRGHFATPSQEPSRGGFGEASGWIWGGFWEGFGWIWDDFGRILNEMLEGFRLKFLSFSDSNLLRILGILKNPGES